jgi:hypothetical protein
VSTSKPYLEMSLITSSHLVPTFPLLNDTNYSEWSMWMESELIQKGFPEVVFKDVERDGKSAEEVAKAIEAWKVKRDKKKMNEVRAEMITRASTGQLAHMQDRDPLVVQELWGFTSTFLPTELGYAVHSSAPLTYVEMVQ